MTSIEVDDYRADLEVHYIILGVACESLVVSMFF